MQNFDYQRLDGHTLSVFVSVCETGSLSKTAVIFGVNQSTISHTVDKMRGALNDPLFIKSGRGITPTEKALQIMPRVKFILANIEGLVTHEDYDPALDTQPAVVAIPTPALLSQMRALQEAITQASPYMQFQIRRLAPREQVEEMLGQGSTEIAIVVSGLKYPPTLSSCYYFEDDLLVYYDPAHRSAVTTTQDYAAARHGAVDFGGSAKSEVEKVLERMGVTRHVAIVAPTASMLGDLIKGTDIIVTMPSALARSAYAGLGTCPVPFEIAKVRYDLVWHRRFQNSGRNSWLRQLILSTSGGQPDD